MHSFFRVFFPAWRFFEDVGPTPQLFYRIKKKSQELSDWSQALLPAPRSWVSVFFNPSGNLELACHSLIERSLQDMAETETKDLEKFSSTVNYRLLCNLIETEIRKITLSSSTVYYQFKIVVREKTGEIYEALVSEDHEVTIDF